MEKDAVTLRVARPQDGPALLEIYRPYVEETAISFETETPTAEEFSRRIQRTLEKYPYLVAQRGGELLGYAYIGPFKERAAYQWSGELTIYLRRDCRGAGVGKKLYAALEALAAAQGFRNLYACIGWPQGDESLVSVNSAQFHRHLGYQLVGMFRRCGYKLGRWHHMVWMEKLLPGDQDAPRPVTPFPQLGEELFRSLGVER